MTGLGGSGKRTLVRIRPSVGLVLASLVMSLAACEGQGEGERCNVENKDASGVSLDCQAPLVCRAAEDLGGETDYCCPVSNPTRPECIGSSGTGGAGGSGGSGGSPGGSGGAGGM